MVNLGEAEEDEELARATASFFLAPLAVSDSSFKFHSTLEVTPCRTARGDR